MHTTWIVLTLALSFVLIGFDARAQEGDGKKAPSLKQAAKSPQFKAAVKKVTDLIGSKPEKLENEEGPTGGMVWKVPHGKADELIDGPVRKDLLAQGAFLFRYENLRGMSIGGQAVPDQIGLLPTTDKYAVLQALETNGANSNVYTEDLIKWLKELEKTQPFELTEAGEDFVAGKFTTPVKDAKALAKKIYEFDPDVVDGAGSTMDKLIESVAAGKLYLWWD